MCTSIKLSVKGEYACFMRPEMKVERVSYDAMTPSAARGILEAIYWKPQIHWIVERISVLNPIRFINLRRNEVGAKVFADLHAEATEKLGELGGKFAGNVDFMAKHTSIIERFGRYPHRNAVLGRTTTDEEAVFLAQPGSSF